MSADARHQSSRGHTGSTADWLDAHYAMARPEYESMLRSAGMLALRADHEVVEQFRDARLQDRDRPIITICGNGPLSAIGARTLQDMGFRDVSYIAGGRAAWAQAGLPLVPPTDD